MAKLILNDKQREAVEYRQGPLLIIAGAGTGKTTVITERIKYLIVHQLARPQEILGLTFTEKAAREMEERIDQAVPYGYTQMWISTFHSFCDRILRNEAVHIGLNPAFRLIGEAAATQLLQTHLWELQLVYFRPRGNPTKFIGALLSHFNRLKDEDISPEQYLAWVKTESRKPNDKKEATIEIAKWRELVKVYQQYEQLKIKEGAMDFADLITNTLQLFRQRSNILREYRNRFKYILVDEFQDTNIAQYELIKLLAPAADHPNLTVVGDDSQSIYKFRGAAVANILAFMDDYKAAKQIILTKNYRSVQTILNHAYRLIRHNNPETLEAKLGIDKNLVSMRSKAQRASVALIYTERIEDEAEAVVQKIKQLRKKSDYLWQDFALLVRANNYAEPFIRAMKRHGIPFQFLGRGQLFRQEEVRDLIAYLKTLAHFDDSTSFYRVLAMDIWGISGRDLSALNTHSMRSGKSLFEVCEEANNLPNISEDTVRALNKLVAIMHRQFELVPKETAGQLLYYFLEDSGLLQYLIGKPESVKQEQQIGNIARFFDKLKTYEAEYEDASVFAVTDWLDLCLELGESPLAADFDWTEENRVNILTVHSAKGLEFPVVFLVNLVNLRFPSINRREQIPIPEKLIRESLPEGDFHEQEERRLFYVGMTRARDYLYFTASKFYGEGKRERKLSVFVKEALGEAYIAGNKEQSKQCQLGLFVDWKKTVEDEKTPVALQPKRKVSFLSYSQINAFQICPLHYKLRYILRVPTPLTPALVLGQSIHNALKDYYNYLIRHNRQSKAILLTCLQQNWLAGKFGNQKTEKENFATARQYLSEFYALEQDKECRTKVVEELFNFPLTATLKIGGRIDRIDLLPDGKIEIIDYKTSENVPTQQQVDNDLQLTIYALAAAEVQHPLLCKQPQEILLSLYYFAQQKKITTTRSARQLLRAKEEIISIARQIESSDFRCSGNKWCKKCEYRLYCNTLGAHRAQ